jgi:hypothetical protein
VLYTPICIPNTFDCQDFSDDLTDLTDSNISNNIGQCARGTKSPSAGVVHSGAPSKFVDSNVPIEALLAIGRGGNGSVWLDEFDPTTSLPILHDSTDSNDSTPLSDSILTRDSTPLWETIPDFCDYIGLEKGPCALDNLLLRVVASPNLRHGAKLRLDRIAFTLGRGPGCTVADNLTELAASGEIPELRPHKFSNYAAAAKLTFGKGRGSRSIFIMAGQSRDSTVIDDIRLEWNPAKGIGPTELILLDKVIRTITGGWGLTYVLSRGRCTRFDTALDFPELEMDEILVWQEGTRSAAKMVTNAQNDLRTCYDGSRWGNRTALYEKRVRNARGRYNEMVRLEPREKPQLRGDMLATMANPFATRHLVKVEGVADALPDGIDVEDFAHTVRCYGLNRAVTVFNPGAARPSNSRAARRIKAAFKDPANSLVPFTDAEWPDLLAGLLRETGLAPYLGGNVVKLADYRQEMRLAA